MSGELLLQFTPHSEWKCLNWIRYWNHIEFLSILISMHSKKCFQINFIQNNCIYSKKHPYSNKHPDLKIKPTIIYTRYDHLKNTLINKCHPSVICVYSNKLTPRTVFIRINMINTVYMYHQKVKSYGLGWCNKTSTNVVVVPSGQSKIYLHWI